MQRVTEARCASAGDVVGEIGAGLCVLVGVTHDDDAARAAKLAAKVANLRVFDDDGGRDEPLVARHRRARRWSSASSRSTATPRAGRRPSWVAAARPEQAEPLVDAFVRDLAALGVPVATGRFRADMQVALVNDGPVTLMLEVP